MMNANSAENYQNTEQPQGNLFDQILASVSAGIDIFRSNGGGADVGGARGVTEQHTGASATKGMDSSFLLLVLLVIAIVVLKD